MIIKSYHSLDNNDTFTDALLFAMSVIRFDGCMIRLKWQKNGTFIAQTDFTSDELINIWEYCVTEAKQICEHVLDKFQYTLTHSLCVRPYYFF